MNTTEMGIERYYTDLLELLPFMYDEYRAGRLNPESFLGALKQSYNQLDGIDAPLTEDVENTNKAESIRFVMREYIPSHEVGNLEFEVENQWTDEPKSVIVRFDPTWSEYVYYINNEGPFAHRSYEFITSDIRDFILRSQTGAVE